MRWCGTVALGLAASVWLAAAGPVASPSPPSPYANWAAIVVAGDWHTQGGLPSPVFDNARRDIAAQLLTIGFDPANVQQFSVRPGRDKVTRPTKTDLQNISTGLAALTSRATGGCLLYFTSHWKPGGLGVGNDKLVPEAMAQIVDDACAKRPTVIVVSACYSGFLIPKLQAPNRLIMTAARKDRTSFGCGQGTRYPYFDQCILARLPVSDGFEELADQVRACVARLEQERAVDNPSEPQLFIGAQLAGKLPSWH